MRAKTIVAAFILAGGLLLGCGRISTDSLADQVKASIEEKWKTQPDLANVQIKSFTLVHKGGKQYRGLLEAEQDGESETLAVDVTYDGSSFMWEVSE